MDGSSERNEEVCKRMLGINPSLNSQQDVLNELLSAPRRTFDSEVPKGIYGELTSEREQENQNELKSRAWELALLCGKCISLAFENSNNTSFSLAVFALTKANTEKPFKTRNEKAKIDTALRSNEFQGPMRSGSCSGHTSSVCFSQSFYPEYQSNQALSVNPYHNYSNSQLCGGYNGSSNTQILQNGMSLKNPALQPPRHSGSPFHDGNFQSVFPKNFLESQNFYGLPHYPSSIPNYGQNCMEEPNGNLNQRQPFVNPNYRPPNGEPMSSENYDNETARLNSPRLPNVASQFQSLPTNSYDETGPFNNKTAKSKGSFSACSVLSTSTASLSTVQDREENDNTSSPSWSTNSPKHCTTNQQPSSWSDAFAKLMDLGSEAERKSFVEKLKDIWDEHNIKFRCLPSITKKPLDLYKLYVLVKERGGYNEVTKSKLWKEIGKILGVGDSASSAFGIKRNYLKLGVYFYECKYDKDNIDPMLSLKEIEKKGNSKKKKPKSCDEKFCKPFSVCDSPCETFAHQQKTPAISPQNMYGTNKSPQLFAQPKPPQILYRDQQFDDDSNQEQSSEQYMDEFLNYPSQQLEFNASRGVFVPNQFANVPFKPPDPPFASLCNPNMYQQHANRMHFESMLIPRCLPGPSMMTPLNPMQRSPVPVAGRVDVATSPDVFHHAATPFSPQEKFRSSFFNKNTSLEAFGTNAKASAAISTNKREFRFPSDSVEAVRITTSKKMKLRAKDVVPVDLWRIYMALKSGLLVETMWAVNVINILLADDSTFPYFDLRGLPGLLHLLLDLFKKALDQILGDLVVKSHDEKDTDDSNSYFFRVGPPNTDFDVVSCDKDCVPLMKPLEISSVDDLSHIQTEIGGACSLINKVRQVPPSCANTKHSDFVSQHSFKKSSRDSCGCCVEFQQEYEESLFAPTKQNGSASLLLAVSMAFRNLSFLACNSHTLCQSELLLSLLGSLLLLYHKHCNCVENDVSNVELPIVSSHYIRENTLVTLSNIAGSLELINFSENVIRTLLDGLIHWAICRTPSARDILLSSNGCSNISAQRLSFEAIAKLSVNASNVDLLLATVSLDQVDDLIDSLSDWWLCDDLDEEDERTLCELSVILISTFSLNSSDAAKVIGEKFLSVNFLLKQLEFELSCGSDGIDCACKCLRCISAISKTLISLSRRKWIENHLLIFLLDSELPCKILHLLSETLNILTQSPC